MKILLEVCVFLSVLIVLYELTWIETSSLGIILAIFGFILAVYGTALIKLFGRKKR